MAHVQEAQVTPPLPASLDDKDLVPWLVALDYGDTDVMTNTDWLRVLAPAYADKAAAVRALVAHFGRAEAC